MSQDVILYTKNIKKAKDEIRDLGGRVTHQMTDNIIVAELPDKIDAITLKVSQADLPRKLDPISQISIDAWRAMQKKKKLAKPSKNEGKDWDSKGYEAP